MKFSALPPLSSLAASSAAQLESEKAIQKATAADYRKWRNEARQRDKDDTKQAAQTSQLVENTSEPLKVEGAWCIWGERAEEVRVYLFNNEADAMRPCALARVFRPETNTIADVVDYVEDPDNKHDIADCIDLQAFYYVFHAMAVCGRRLMPLRCYQDGTVSFHTHPTIAIKSLPTDLHELEELDPAAPEG